MEHDELIRRLIGQNPSANELQGNLNLQSGLLDGGSWGSTEQADGGSTQNPLDSLRQRNQANTQSMQAIGQNTLQQAMQTSQGIQAQRQAQMNAASQQAAQAAQAAQQKQGQLFGTLLKYYIGGGN